jgi:NADH:ubiquinone oxidoreductase subunit F (NADH-binding)
LDGKILQKFLNGTANESDVDLLWDIQSKIEGKTICPLGEAAAWPVAAAIRHFKQEFIDIAKSKKFVDISHYDRLNKLVKA